MGVWGSAVRRLRPFSFILNHPIENLHRKLTFSLKTEAEMLFYDQPTSLTTILNLYSPAVLKKK